VSFPKGYEWLGNIGTLPRAVQEALKLHGTTEVPGAKNSPVIMGWADAVGTKAIGYKYTGDSVPWCGLFMAYVMLQAGKELPFGPLYATNWSAFGKKVKSPKLGDVLTFKRTGGGHVALYIAEDSEAYHVLGGNQSDAVTITRIAKSRLFSATQVPFKSTLPASYQAYRVASTGKLSTNEA